MKLRRWNYEKREYLEVEIPENYNIRLYCGDMEEIVNCPNCGKELKYGETYTSKEHHNSIGLCYGVCEDCHNEEWKRRMEYEKN